MRDRGGYVSCDFDMYIYTSHSQFEHDKRAYTLGYTGILLVSVVWVVYNVGYNFKGVTKNGGKSVSLYNVHKYWTRVKEAKEWRGGVTRKQMRRVGTK